jgi:CheY-like chemotaxis protein
VAEAATPRVIRRTAGAKVLWVDDRPKNNVYERQALEALGVGFVLALSTDEALEKLARQKFDAIISDMGRPPDPQAGYTLLDHLRASGDRTPFIIYAGSRAPEHQAESRRRGAVGCTNQPSELLEMVLAAIGRGA